MTNTNMGTPRRHDLYIAEREKGLTYKEIAAKFGVSHQTVAQSCARYSPGHFKPYTVGEVIYPHLRRWLNENKVSRTEFARRLGALGMANSSNQISDWFRGRNYPIKKTIDKMINITGLSYEQLFAEE